MEVPWRDRYPAPGATLIVAAASAIVTAIAIVAIDKPLARLMSEYEASKLWNKAIEILEWTLGLPFFKLFAPVVLVTAMLACVAVPRLRGYAPAFMLLAGTHVISRFLTVKIKDATGRLRPGEWLKQGAPDETFLWDGGVAFPSGHVTLFASILIPLAIVVPRTRPLLAIIAFVMVARVAVNGHWVSDVVGGITLVASVAWGLSLLVRPRRTG